MTSQQQRQVHSLPPYDPELIAGVHDPELIAVGSDQMFALASVDALAGDAPSPWDLHIPLGSTDMEANELTIYWDAAVNTTGAPVIGYVVSVSGQYTRPDGSLSTYEPVQLGADARSYTWHVPKGTPSSCRRRWPQ